MCFVLNAFSILNEISGKRFTQLTELAGKQNVDDKENNRRCHIWAITLFELQFLAEALLRYVTLELFVLFFFLICIFQYMYSNGLKTINILRPDFPEHFVKLDYEYTNICFNDHFQFIFGHIMRTVILKDFKLDDIKDTSHHGAMTG